jgi:hypothetical protein
VDNQWERVGFDGVEKFVLVVRVDPAVFNRTTLWRQRNFGWDLIVDDLRGFRSEPSDTACAVAAPALGKIPQEERGEIWEGAAAIV